MDLVYILVLKHCLNLQRHFRAISERCQDRRQPTETGTGYLPNTNRERYVSTVPFGL
jgi:hypothetical protein